MYIQALGTDSSNSPRIFSAPHRGVTIHHMLGASRNVKLNWLLLAYVKGWYVDIVQWEAEGSKLPLHSKVDFGHRIRWRSDMAGERWMHVVGWCLRGFFIYPFSRPHHEIMTLDEGMDEVELGGWVDEEGDRAEGEAGGSAAGAEVFTVSTDCWLVHGAGSVDCCFLSGTGVEGTAEVGALEDVTGSGDELVKGLM